MDRFDHGGLVTSGDFHLAEAEREAGSPGSAGLTHLEALDQRRMLDEAEKERKEFGLAPDAGLAEFFVFVGFVAGTAVIAALVGPFLLKAGIFDVTFITAASLAIVLAVVLVTSWLYKKLESKQRS